MARVLLITPARDEAAYLERTIRGVLAQNRPPDLWLIVDDGSTDGTLELALELARANSWIAVLESPRDRRAGEVPVGRKLGRDMTAFNLGLNRLDTACDAIVKLDADVSTSRTTLAAIRKKAEARRADENASSKPPPP